MTDERMLQAASGTVSGDIILWTPPATQEGSRLGSRRVAKIISIHSSPITSLSCVDRFLVSGAADGYVRFFDSRLRLVAWFEVSAAGIGLLLFCAEAQLCCL